MSSLALLAACGSSTADATGIGDAATAGDDGAHVDASGDADVDSLSDESDAACPCVDKAGLPGAMYRVSPECYPLGRTSYEPYEMNPCFGLPIVTWPNYVGTRFDATYPSENLVSVTLNTNESTTTMYFDATSKAMVGAVRSGLRPDPIYCSGVFLPSTTTVEAGTLAQTPPDKKFQTCPPDAGKRDASAAD